MGNCYGIIKGLLLMVIIMPSIRMKCTLIWNFALSNARWGAYFFGFLAAPNGH